MRALGLLRLKSELMRERARSRCRRRRSVPLKVDLEGVEGDAALSSLEEASVSLGRRTVSVLEETKMGVLPGAPTGNLGTGTRGLDEVVGSTSTTVLSVSSDFFSSLFLLLNFWSWSLCLSFRRALKGLGLLNLRLGMILIPEGFSVTAWDALTTAPLELTFAGLMLEADAGLMLLTLLLLNLVRPRLALTREALPTLEAWLG